MERGFQEALREGRTLVVIDYITQMVTTSIVCFADAHGIVREVDIAVIAWFGSVLRLRSWGRGRFALGKTYRRLCSWLADVTIRLRKRNLHFGILTKSDYVVRK